MSAKQLMFPANRAFNSDGAPVPGATLYLYASGSTTPANFYADVGLTVSLGSHITANSAGRFTPIPYQDSATPFRIILEDKDGAVLDDIDPFYFGQNIYNVSGSLTASSRAILATLTAASTTGVALSESGREGLFVWSSSNLSANVAADTQQGLYVAPVSDATGTSGAWVRKFSGSIDIRWFGAVNDCTAFGVGTDSAPAINGAISIAAVIGKSAEVLIPKGMLGFRTASTITLYNGIKVRGQGFHENPGVVNGVTYTTPQTYRGSLLVFDANVKGMEFFSYTDNAANAQAFEFENSIYSVLEDVMLIGGGGTSITADGILSHTVLRARNVRVHGFAANGLQIQADGAGTATYGNANGTSLTDVITDGNGMHGKIFRGSNANVINVRGGASNNNGGFNVADLTTVGNHSFVGHQVATGNRSYGASTPQRTQVLIDCPALSDQYAGSYFQSVGNESVFQACYVESGTGSKAELLAPTQVIGGFLSETAFQTANFTALYMNGTNNGILGNVAAITPSTGNMTLTGNMTITRAGNNIATLNLSPGGTQVYSQVTLKGNGGSAVLGLDILAGSGVGYLSADTIVLRNAAQSTTFGTWSASGLNMGAASALSFGGTTILNSSGVLQAAGFPALTGDITTTAGSLATTIPAGTVTLAKMANMATASLIYRKTAGSGAPEVNTLATLKTDLGLTGTNSGDQTITLTGNVTGSGTGSFATVVASVPAAAMPALTGDITTSAGAVATTLATNVVTYAKFQQVAASSLVGNATGSLANAAGITLAGGLAFSGTTLTAAGALTPTSVASTGAVSGTTITGSTSVLSTGTGGVGYNTGAGGAVTQLTSRATGVTLNKTCGAITLFSAAGSATWATFTVTNSTVVATDVIELCQKSGANLYNLIVTAVGAGTFNISVSAVSGTATEAPVINFTVLKAVTA